MWNARMQEYVIDQVGIVYAMMAILEMPVKEVSI